jgi:hypothetical protein
MVHIILAVAIILATWILSLIAFAGVKFYKLNSGVESADKDTTKLKVIIVALTALVSSAAVAMLFI